MRNYTMEEVSVEELEKLSQIDYLAHFLYHIGNSYRWMEKARLSMNLKFIDYARKEVYQAYHQDKVLMDQKLLNFAKCVLEQIAYVEKTIGENLGGDEE